MRIIGGEAKGRQLHFLSGSKERPTSDFLREALFNLLGPLKDKIFLDLFSGSGSVGLEAASRGVQEVCFVEKNKDLVTVIKRNIQTCCLDEICNVIADDIERALPWFSKKHCAFDIIFADPPYNRKLIRATIALLNRYQILKDGGLIVIQHSVKESFDEDMVNYIQLTDQRKYGENALTFLKWMERK